MGETTHTSDVVIAGAGPAGSALAALLASRGLDVLLVDRASFPRDKTCGDGLTPRAIPVLQRLGVLGDLEARGYQRVSGARLHPAYGAPWTLNFAEYPMDMPPYGLVVPRFELDHILLQNALARGTRFLPGFDALAPLRAPEGGPVRGLSGEVGGSKATARARLTVLAVGANMRLPREFGVLQNMPPGLNAIRGYFDGVPDLGPHFEFYFERELAPGYAWVFPLKGGLANIGLGVAARKGRADSRNLRQLLHEFLQRSPRLRAATPAGPLKGYPLRTDFPSHRAGGDGFILVGEALGLVNPVTGEGIDLALESAALAAPFAEAALAAGEVTWRSIVPYQAALNTHYASFFRGVRALMRLATGPRAIAILVRQAKKKPRLARLIAGINLGVASPWQAFSPLTWWDILT